MPKQVVSKKRVVDHGEVYTGTREVNAMLDLVNHETERIDSRFLEPACGTGNFLTEILTRKLRVVEDRYRKNRLEYERYSFSAVSSLYGIDILPDNVIECRKRLFELVDQKYTDFYRRTAREDHRHAIQFVLERNIIWGDALTLKTKDNPPQPIVFSEWSFATGSMIKRRDFTFHEIYHQESKKKTPHFSDLGEEVFIAQPVNEFPLIHFLRVADAEK